MKEFWEKHEEAWSRDSIRHISTPSTMARSALFYVQEIGHFKTHHPFYTERESLNSYLMVYTNSGKGTLIYKEEEYELHPHDLFLIDCKNYQFYKAQKGHHWDILWLHLNGATTSGYYQHYSKKKSPVVRLVQPTIPQTMEDLLKLQKQELTSVKKELKSSNLIAHLLTEILLTVPELNTLNPETPDYILGIQKELEDKFQNKISLNDLAKKFAINKYQLVKEFKLHIGFTPHEYLINRRITAAKELLKNSDFPISDISWIVGIDNVSHFINLFKKRVQMTPLSYRKHWKSIHTSKRERVN